MNYSIMQEESTKTEEQIKKALANKMCPVCNKSLELKQISCTTAIYLCVDLNCIYPDGYDCIEVARPLEKINEVPPKQPEVVLGPNRSEADEINRDLDSWLDDLCAVIEPTNNSSSSSNTPVILENILLNPPRPPNNNNYVEHQNLLSNDGLDDLFNMLEGC